MPSSRAASTARTQILEELREDHKRVKKAYKQFQKLDASDDPEACAEIVEMVLDELTVHAQIEEELLYPAARGQLKDTSLIDEAEVEHESMHTLIDQLRGMNPEDEKYAARFTVLCEYVLHHVKEEEGEMFPQLEKAKLDWEGLAGEMTARREELMPAEGEEDEADDTTASTAEGREGAGGAAEAEVLADEDAPPARGSRRGR